MVFTLRDVSKKYQSHWLFKHIDFDFRQNETIGISGPNGSGKSTLMKIIAGFVTPSKGNVELSIGDLIIKADSLSEHISFSAPYISAPQDFRLHELVAYHMRFREMKQISTPEDILSIAELSDHRDKLVRELSSGMAHRLHLALILNTATPILLLDEPSSNLDDRYKSWMKDQILTCKKDRIVIIASNERMDLELCDRMLRIEDHR